MTNLILGEVAYNNDSFQYGAVFDDLNYTDVDYVIGTDIDNAWLEGDETKPAVAGTPYYQVRKGIEADAPQWMQNLFPNGRPLTNKDQILGISSMEYNISSSVDDVRENRVFFLDPLTYGGSYLNPPMYIAPLENQGWMAFVDVVFPEMSPCKPYTTDLVDFGDIQQKINDAYPSIPEDERLKDDPAVSYTHLTLPTIYSV